MAGVAACAQVVTPRMKMVPIYRHADMDSGIVAEVEPDGRWRLDFSGAEAAARLPAETPGLGLTFLLPARDDGFAVMARVRGRGRKNLGWVEADKVDISLDLAWKLPTSTLVFVPMKARQIPPLRSLPEAKDLAAHRGSYLLLVDPEGGVVAVRPLEGAGDQAVEAAVRRFRFAPIRVEGESVHVLLALRLQPQSQEKPQ